MCLKIKYIDRKLILTIHALTCLKTATKLQLTGFEPAIVNFIVAGDELVRRLSYVMPTYRPLVPPFFTLGVWAVV